MRVPAEGTTSRTSRPEGCGRDCDSIATVRANSFASSAAAPRPAPSASIRTDPAWTRCSRAMARSAVDLPLPFGPMSAVTAPGRRLSDVVHDGVRP
jgi:hypothetical protein